MGEIGFETLQNKTKSSSRSGGHSVVKFSGEIGFEKPPKIPLGISLKMFYPNLSDNSFSRSFRTLVTKVDVSRGQWSGGEPLICPYLFEVKVDKMTKMTEELRDSIV